MPKVRIDETLEMHYEDDDFTDPWKPTETVVLQHCNGGSGKLYYRWVPQVARHYRFIRVDRRGQGQSTVPPPGHHWWMREWVHEQDVFLDRLGLQKVHLIGEATGSYACVHYAHEHPDRVSSLTLINSGVKLGARPELLEYDRMRETEGIESWVRKTMASRFDASQVDPDYIEWHAQEKIKQPHHVTTEVGKYAHTVDVTDILPQISVPTLVIAAGGGGLVHSMDTAQRLTELIPDCKFVSISGVSGYVAHAAPERCAEAWLEFVKGLS